MPHELDTADGCWEEIRRNLSHLLLQDSVKADTTKPEVAALANNLDHSRLFDMHRWSNDPEVAAAVDLIYPDLVRLMTRHHKNSVRKHLRVVILNLYAAWLEAPRMYISYHRDKNAYRPKSRYNALGIGFLTTDVVDALEALEYVESHKGFHDRSGGTRRTSRISRMRATKCLIDLVQRCRVEPRVANHYAKTECIVLRRRIPKRDGKKLGSVGVMYRDTPETRRMRVDLLPNFHTSAD